MINILNNINNSNYDKKKDMKILWITAKRQQEHNVTLFKSLYSTYLFQLSRHYFF